MRRYYNGRRGHLGRPQSRWYLFCELPIPQVQDLTISSVVDLKFSMGHEKYAVSRRVLSND